MWPIPYTGLKAVHDQKIEEALERSRCATEQATRKHSLLQTFGTFLARLTSSSERKSETTISACDAEEEETSY